MNAELEQIWLQIQSELRAAVDDTTYRIWLEPLRILDFNDGKVLLEVSPQAYGWVLDRFGRLLQTCAAAVLGPDTLVDLSRSGHTPADHERYRHQAEPTNTHEQAGAGWRNPQALLELGGNPKLTFDHFVIGDCNRLAHAAALAVAELPSQAYNPLFICGPPGVGKTHLLQSISSLLLEHNPTLCIRARTGESFTNEFQVALAGGAMKDFKARFRRVDVLLIDDVQFFERKTRTEEEFFHTFNSIYDAGGQIVLTSDRPPRDLQALEDRLRERFQAGLVADIAPPDFATRLGILRKRAQHDGIKLRDPHVLELLAKHVTTNVRALEGALIRVVALSSLAKRPIDAELTAEVLENLYSHRDTSHGEGRIQSVTQIQEAICRQFDISQQELLSSQRSQRIAWPRQMAMYLARELTDDSLPSIGRQFGGRDHTTVLHAWKRTGERIRRDSGLRDIYENLCKELGAWDHDRQA